MKNKETIAIPVKKNDKIVVDILDNGFKGEGIAKVDGYTIFIPNVLKDEKCEIIIVKVLASHGYGQLIKILEPSEQRACSDCETYNRCGGCDLRHMKYEFTLELKKQVVQSLVNKELKNEIEVMDTIGMNTPFYYRNKAQFPIGLNKEKMPEIGVFAQRTHEIVPIKDCKIQTEISQKIAKRVIEFIRKNKISVYDEQKREGLFRNIVIKVGMKTQEVMCIFVVNGNGEEEKINDLTKELCNEFKEIRTVVKNINEKNTNVILGDKNINLYGDGYIEDILGEYRFKISPMSFYQINPVQAEVLYNMAIDGANLNKEDVLFDLYCGIGTIGIFASKYVKSVYGIEIVKQAIEYAKENAKINNVKNISFICGDVEEAFDKLINKNNVKPTVIIVDPPRRGLDDKTVQNILNLRTKKVVYVSCNPATMVRDIKKLDGTYIVEKIQPVDMFPYTHHVECVAVLNAR